MFKAIGSFFGKIWSWIKNTAWVQPLLIVGILFGVIFSIPAIANGINGLVESSGSSTTFYQKFQISLANGENSQAQKLTDYILEGPKNGDKSLSGGKDKFILMFVAEDCEGCKKAFDGFKLTTDSSKWKNGYNPVDNKDFKLITIFTDEVTSETTKDKTAFDNYLDRNKTLFEDAADCAYNSWYYANDKISATDIQNLENADHDNFVTPTCILYELEGDYWMPTEVMFQVGDGNGNSRAKTITDFWNHEGLFSEDGKRS